MVKIATFNVNSVKARLENIAQWLKSSECDIALLQEIKCEDVAFPTEEFFDLGYNCAVFGQKSYNGVAILSKFKIEDIIKTIPGFDKDVGIKMKSGGDLFSQDRVFSQQARYIEAVIPIKDKAIRVASIYVPNGGGALEGDERLEDSVKFRYKMDFFDALKEHMKGGMKDNEIVIYGGDYNVAINDIDVYDPKSLEGTVCFHHLEQQKMRSLLNLGLTDCYRALHPDAQSFSWWDYRSGAWNYNKGMRIDYLLASPLAADLLVSCSAHDKGVRDQKKASDHCPVIIELDI